VTAQYRATMAAVFAMLDDCARGHTRRIGTHRLVVTWRGQTYMGLPKGPGGGADVASAVVAHAEIRKAVRMLGIDPECARRHFGNL
jgi:hypothetical protein